MSLDERVRTGLRRSADAGGLDADELFDGVLSAHRRGRLRARVFRQATAVAVVLTLFVGVAIFVSWRNTPLRYRSVATVGLGSLPTAQAGKTADDALALALAPSTRRATLLAAHLSPDNTEVAFRAAGAGTNKLSLAATAASKDESALVTDKWASTLAVARKREAVDRLIKARRDLTRRVTSLHRQLQVVDTQLAKLDPKVYGTVWKYDGPNIFQRPKAPPPVPERGTPHELNLAFERIQLRSELDKYGRGLYDALTPYVVTRRIDQTAPTRVDGTPSAAVPATAAWLGGIALICAAAFVFYRLRARAPQRT